jgi:hypothetical protein
LFLLFSRYHKWKQVPAAAAAAAANAANTKMCCLYLLTIFSFYF